jgi:hypothetical protein
VPVPLPVVAIDAAFPATALEGARRSVSWAGAAAARHSTPTKKARVPCSRTLLKL